MGNESREEGSNTMTLYESSTEPSKCWKALQGVSACLTVILTALVVSWLLCVSACAGQECTHFYFGPTRCHIIIDKSLFSVRGVGWNFTFAHGSISLLGRPRSINEICGLEVSEDIMSSRVRWSRNKTLRDMIGEISNQTWKLCQDRTLGAVTAPNFTYGAYNPIPSFAFGASAHRDGLYYRCPGGPWMGLESIDWCVIAVLWVVLHIVKCHAICSQWRGTPWGRGIGTECQGSNPTTRLRILAQRFFDWFIVMFIIATAMYTFVVVLVIPFYAGFSDVQAGKNLFDGETSSLDQQHFWMVQCFAWGVASCLCFVKFPCPAWAHLSQYCLTSLLPLCILSAITSAEDVGVESRPLLMLRIPLKFSAMVIPACAVVVIVLIFAAIGELWHAQSVQKVTMAVKFGFPLGCMIVFCFASAGNITFVINFRLMFQFNLSWHVSILWGIIRIILAVKGLLEFIAFCLPMTAIFKYKCRAARCLTCCARPRSSFGPHQGTRLP